jgi:hypothetical protein
LSCAHLTRRTGRLRVAQARRWSSAPEQAASQSVFGSTAAAAARGPLPPPPPPPPPASGAWRAVKTALGVTVALVGGSVAYVAASACPPRGRPTL